MNDTSAPDLILENAKITTLDRAKPEATSLVVKNGRIVGVDDAEEYQRGPDTKVIDLQGRRVIPGLNDSHMHVIRCGPAATPKTLPIHRRVKSSATETATPPDSSSPAPMPEFFTLPSASNPSCRLNSR